MEINYVLHNIFIGVTSMSFKEKEIFRSLISSTMLSILQSINQHSTSSSVVRLDMYSNTVSSINTLLVYLKNIVRDIWVCMYMYVNVCECMYIVIILRCYILRLSCKYVCTIVIYITIIIIITIILYV
jgi:hypothetical protein